MLQQGRSEGTAILHRHPSSPLLRTDATYEYPWAHCNVKEEEKERNPGQDGTTQAKDRDGVPQSQ